MLAALVSFAAVVSAAPATSRAQLNVFGSVGYATIAVPPSVIVGGFSPQPVPPPEEHSVLGLAGLELTLYPQHPLVDTDAPLSLQPFLERLSTLRLKASGGGFDTVETVSAPPFRGERTEQQAAATASADIYATGHFIVGGSFGLNWSTATDTGSFMAPRVQTTWALPVSLTLGGRFHDTRIDASWSVTPADVNGAWGVSFWGGAGVSIESVFQRQLDLYVNVHAIDQGAFGTLGVAIYPFRRFGFYGSFFGGGGRLFISDSANLKRFGGTIGLSLWASRHFGGAFTYSPAWTSGPSENLQHTFTLELFSRVR